MPGAPSRELLPCGLSRPRRGRRRERGLARPRLRGPHRLGAGRPPPRGGPPEAALSGARDARGGRRPRGGARAYLPARARRTVARGRARRGRARLAPLRPHPAGERLHREREVPRRRPRSHAGHARDRPPLYRKENGKGRPDLDGPDAQPAARRALPEAAPRRVRRRHRRGARGLQRRAGPRARAGRRRSGLAPGRRVPGVDPVRGDAPLRQARPVLPGPTPRSTGCRSRPRAARRSHASPAPSP